MLAEHSPTPGLTVADRLRIAFELHDAGVQMMRQNLRRAHAEATEEEIERLLVRWIRRETT